MIVFFLRLALLIIVACTALLVVLGQLGLFEGKRPSGLGVHNGQLRPPSRTANSVSSQAALHVQHPMRGYAQIDPFTYTSEPEAAWEKLKATLRAHPGTILTPTNDPIYLHAQSTTLFLRFTDDLEFLHDSANKTIHVRSASRLGRRDFGTNRKRIEAIRRAYLALNP